MILLSFFNMLGYTMASDTVVVHRCKFGVSRVDELLVIKLVCLCKVSWNCREANIASCSWEISGERLFWLPKNNHFGEIFFPWYLSANTRILFLVTLSFWRTQHDTYFTFCILHYIRGNKMFAAFNYHYSKIFFLNWNWFLQVVDIQQN